jgi:hypothetical protein
MEEGPTEVPEDEDEEIIEEEVIEEEIIETVHRRISMEDPPTERYNPDDEPEEDIEHVQDQGAVTSKVSDVCGIKCYAFVVVVVLTKHYILCLFQYMHTLPVALYSQEARKRE